MSRIFVQVLLKSSAQLPPVVAVLRYRTVDSEDTFHRGYTVPVKLVKRQAPRALVGLCISLRCGSYLV